MHHGYKEYPSLNWEQKIRSVVGRGFMAQRKWLMCFLSPPELVLGKILYFLECAQVIRQAYASRLCQPGFPKWLLGPP